MTTAVTTARALDNFTPYTFDNDISQNDTYNVMDEYDLYENGFPLHNKYKFIRLLQTGSFGKVTLAVDETSGIKYAIKSMYRKQGAMFRHEINMMKKLGKHPNLIELIEHFDTLNYHILVLEYCDDGDLYDKIEEMTSLSGTPIFTLHLIRQLVQSIKYMHSKRIYHRDLKPENILLMQNGDLKLCDFGLSTVLQFPNEIDIGTEKYMSPESINERNYDAKLADYWSLGITLCFLLFGKCPFRKASLDDDHFINYINNPQWLLSYYNNMSFKTFKAISKLLSLSPQDRDIDQFEIEFIEASQSGLTIDQELELTTSSNLDGYVFDMDGDDNDKKEFMDIDDNDELFEFNDDQFMVPPPAQQHLQHTNPPPSLIESHMNSFSWADDDGFETRFNQQLLHLQIINDDNFNVGNKTNNL